MYRARDVAARADAFEAIVRRGLCFAACHDGVVNPAQIFRPPVGMRCAEVAATRSCGVVVSTLEAAIGTMPSKIRSRMTPRRSRCNGDVSRRLRSCTGSK